MSVTLDIQNAMLILHIILSWLLSGSTIFFHIVPYMARFTGKNIEHEMCFVIFSTAFA